MSYESDYRSGRSGMAGGNQSSEGWMNGAQERLTRDIEKQERQRAELARTSHTNPFGNAPTTFDTAPAYSGGSSSRGDSSPATLKGSAQSGAVVLAVLYGAYALLAGMGLTWAELGVRVAGAALLGAIAGAALYVAVKVLAFALSIAFRVLAVVLVSGIALHFLGIVNFWAFSGRLLRSVGL